MKRAITRRAGLSLGAAALAAALLPPGISGADAQTVTLRVSSFAPAGTFVNTDVIGGFLDRVVADSEGTLAWQLFPGGTLGRNPAEQLRLVQEGVADMAFVVPSYSPGAFDSYGVVEVPGVVTNPRESAMALWRAYEEGLLQTPEGVKVLGMFSSEVNVIHLRAPAEGLADLRGKRLRAVGRPQAEAVSRLGGAAVTGLSAPEVAENMSRGTIDGALMGWAATATFRVDAVARATLEVPMGAVGLMLPINQATWDRLPEPARAAFERHMGAPFAEAAGARFLQEDLDVRERALAQDGYRLIAAEAGVMADYAAALGEIEEVWIDGSEERRAVLARFREIVEEVRAE